MQLIESHYDNKVRRIKKKSISFTMENLKKKNTYEHDFQSNFSIVLASLEKMETKTGQSERSCGSMIGAIGQQ